MTAERPLTAAELLRTLAERVRHCINSPSGEFLPLRFANLIEGDANDIQAKSKAGVVASELVDVAALPSPAPVATQGAPKFDPSLDCRLPSDATCRYPQCNCEEPIPKSPQGEKGDGKTTEPRELGPETVSACVPVEASPDPSPDKSTPPPQGNGELLPCDPECLSSKPHEWTIGYSVETGKSVRVCSRCFAVRNYPVTPSPAPQAGKTGADWLEDAKRFRARLDEMKADGTLDRHHRELAAVLSDFVIAPSPAPLSDDAVRECDRLKRQWNERGDYWSKTMAAGEAMYKHLDHLVQRIREKDAEIAELTESVNDGQRLWAQAADESNANLMVTKQALDKLEKADGVVWAYERGTGHWSFDGVRGPLINADYKAAIARHRARLAALSPTTPDGKDT